MIKDFLKIKHLTLKISLAHSIMMFLVWMLIAIYENENGIFVTLYRIYQNDFDSHMFFNPFYSIVSCLPIVCSIYFLLKNKSFNLKHNYYHMFYNIFIMIYPFIYSLNFGTMISKWDLAFFFWMPFLLMVLEYLYLKYLNEDIPNSNSYGNIYLVAAITTTLFIPEIAKIIFINNWLDAVRYEMFGVLNFAVHICYILHDLLSVAFFKNLLKRFDVADEFI